MKKNESIVKLKAIYDISNRQNASLVDGRLDEALTLQQERESIASEIEEGAMGFSSDDVEVNNIVSAIMENDRRISMLVEERLAGVKKNLMKLKEAGPAIAAYNNELKL